MKCYRCHGTGLIPGFWHIANGRCFRCMGSGELPERAKNNIGYSREILKTYMQDGFFPEDQSGMTKVTCIGNQGHATAEKWILKEGKFYYIGKPVCRASGWEKVPENEMPDFLMHYNKVYKTSIAI